MKVQKILIVALFVMIFQNCRIDSNDNTQDFAKEPDETVNRGSSDETTPVKMFDYITGTWTINKVVRGNENVTSESGIRKTHKIEFTREGRYMRYSEKNPVDSGAYRVNEQQKTLYLESESTEKPEEWNVSFMEDGLMSMEIRNAGGHAGNITYFYKREGEREKENVDLVGDENE